MNQELVSAALALGASTHLNAFGDVVRPAQMSGAGLLYPRSDLEIALELLTRLPGGSIKIMCGKRLKFVVMLDERTTLGEFADLGRAASALAQRLSLLEHELLQSACA